MASEYRRVVVYLCVWLACIDSIRSLAVDSTAPKSHEQSEADYNKLQDLIRQEIFGLVRNGADAPDAALYAADNPVGTQVRHLTGPKGRRWRDLLFGYGDGTQQNGVASLSNRFRRPPPPPRKNNRVDETYDYFVDGGANPEYAPSQNLYPSYDYRPAGGDQMMYDAYDGYGRRPTMMWNGAGVPPSSYVYNDQPARGPARRMGMRPPSPDSFSTTDNGGPMQILESIGGRPGTYLVRVPGPRRKNNPNAGATTSLPSSQWINSDSEGYTVIPIDESVSDRLLDGSGIPMRVDGKGNNPNAISRLPIPGSQSINSANAGIPTDIEVPLVSGGQPSSSQSITVPVGTPQSGGNRVQIPINKNDLRVEGAGFPSTDGINVNMVDLLPGSESLSNSVAMPIRMDGKRNNPTQISRISVPGAQYITPENMDVIDSGGMSTNLKLLPETVGQQSLQTFALPTSGSKGSRIQLPVSMNDLPVDESGFVNNLDLPIGADGLSVGSGGLGPRIGGGGFNTDVDTNGFSVAPEGLGFKIGDGGFLSNSELPTRGNGIKIGNNQITVPSLEALSTGSGGPISTMSLPSMDLSRTPGSFRVTSGRVGQTSPTSSIIQTLPGLVSMSDADAQPNYDIQNMRNVEELSNPPGTVEIPNIDLEQMSGAIMPTDSSQPSELVDAMSSGVESPLSLVNQGALSMTNEPTTLLSDLNPSKMLTTAQDAGRPVVKGMSKILSGLRPSFLGGKSSQPTVVSMGENALPSVNTVEAQSNGDEQMVYASPAGTETEILTDENKNSKIQAEPTMTNSVNFAQNAPGSFTTNGNTMGAKRRGTNQPGNYYIIQSPEGFPDMFTDNVGTYESQPRPQTSKFATRNQKQQPMGEISSVTSSGNGLEFGPTQNTVKAGMTRMMSSGAGGDGSGAFKVGARNSGKQRQYKVLVVDGDHEILRGLRLPGMEPDSGVPSEV